MSSCPNSSIAFSTRASHTPSCVRSPPKTAVSPSISAAASAARSASRSFTRTRAPWAQRSSAVARPIPRAEPVTIAALPSSTFMSPLLSLACPRSLRGRCGVNVIRIVAMSTRVDRSLTQGDVLWTPPADARERFEVGRFLEWLRTERGLDFPGYHELHRWSVSDLEGFWSSLWDFFQIRTHAPYERVLGSREMPGAEWFPGARLNYAEHMVGLDEDTDAVAIVAHSQSREPLELTFGELREQVARARAGLQRLGIGPGDRVVAYLPNIPETLVAFLAP